MYIFLEELEGKCARDMFYVTKKVLLPGRREKSRTALCKAFWDD
jgi:hypothetical protein